MRVLLVSSLSRGGPVEQTLLLARELRELGIGVHVASAEPAVVTRLRQAGVEASTLPLAAGVDLRGAARLWRRMSSADVVHAQDRRSGLWTRLAPGMRSVARVYTVHGLPDPYMPPPVGVERPGLRDRLAYEIVDAGLGRRSDALIIPSQALADEFTGRLRLPRQRITVIPNGVDRAPSVVPGGEEVGTLSLLEPVKDVSTFLRAAAILTGERPALRFLVAGDGRLRDALRREAAALGLTGVVDFPGFLERERALERLAVLVMPSVVENAPMAILEAMSAGVPIVASRTGGIPELVGDTAQLVSPGDAPGFAAAIGSLLDDPRRARAQADAATARVAERYTAAGNARATLAVYERALASRRRLS